MSARGADERARDARRVIDAARAVTGGRAALAAEIARGAGLSPEGVELAFARHLELDATDAQLAQLVARAGDAPRVHVILSAGVFVAALRAVALALAASDEVTVRPSRRDPAFARALVAALRARGDARVALAEDLAPDAVERGEIHVYGRDDTIARVRGAARPGVRVRAHGAGMGVAWLDARAPIAESADALADDVVPFDQRGCLSPRVALVEGDPSRALDFARALHASLGARALGVPRGALTADEAADAARWRDTMTLAGDAWSAADHAVAVAPPGAPLTVPPPGRHVHIASIADARAAAALLAPLARFVVALGASDPARAALLAPPHARVSPLGAMQRPPLDGPVDLRDPFA